MGIFTRPSLTAVLGPTNTGKTHLAVERMCGHSSGMIGFPLRLLAREVYDRVVALKGADQVALITGEEKIVPRNARYFLSTAESMPLDQDVAFLALDEAQMSADDERGHIFTDRLLRARGREETMILGADTLRPLVSRLLPEAEIIARPRFSTLSHIEPRKLGRLPRRTAIVAFTAEHVYAIAEMIRRQKGGAAVVMGALSPRTRNAQVAMFQSGEVDYLVATDAIGMGLNMDITHVAFASLTKFDGKRLRRLHPAELAQIAGRAGRHQRDGSFGAVHFTTSDKLAFDMDEVLAVETHRFRPLERLRWRNPNMDFASIDALIASLEQPSTRPDLERTSETLDLTILKRLSMDPDIVARARSGGALRKLWAACQLPDYRKTSPETHAPLIARIFRCLTDPMGRIPSQWIAQELARLDTIQGDIATLSGRIAAIRTWTYAAHQADWVQDAETWAARTREVEDKLSDALHLSLTQRFVDRRTSVLMRDLSYTEALSVRIDADGAVEVEGEALGTLNGFAFSVDPTSSHSEKRLVMAAAEKALHHELRRRARQLAGDHHDEFAMVPGEVRPVLTWRGAAVAELHPGRSLACPQIRLIAGAQSLPGDQKAPILERLKAWLTEQLRIRLRPLAELDTLLYDQPNRVSGACRGIAYQLLAQAGCLERTAVADLIATLELSDRAALRGCGIQIGSMHLFAPALLKPEANRWRIALWRVVHPGEPEPPVATNGRTSIPNPRQSARTALTIAGFWPVGDKAIRIDRVERVADLAREFSRQPGPFVPPLSLAQEAGLSRPETESLLSSLGYKRRVLQSVAAADSSVPPDPIIAFEWQGRRNRTKAMPAAVPIFEGSPFAVLAQITPARRSTAG